MVSFYLSASHRYFHRGEIKNMEEKKAKVEELFQELVRVIAENFVATYEFEEENVLTMRIPNGQQFQIAVQESKLKKSSDWLQSLDFYIST